MHSKKTDSKEFQFINSQGSTFIFPFRVGDVVKVCNWGKSYTTYSNAFFYFTHTYTPPYYSHVFWDEKVSETEFKIVDIAEHGTYPCVIAYIQDRNGCGIVIGMDGLKLVKQYPLRIGETTLIKLEKIPIITEQTNRP